MRAEPSPDVIPGRVLGAVMYPEECAFVAVRGQGAYLWSTDGRKFVDHVLGSGPMVLGHAHPRVVAAIAEQAGRGTQYFVLNEPALRLAHRISELVPCARALKFLADGSQATFYCMRLARAFTRRTKILKFEGGFHGHHDYAQHGMVARKSNDPYSAANSAGIPREISGTVLVAPYNDIEATREIMSAHGPDIAAIIVEPIQRTLMPRPGFLAGLRQLCEENGSLLVFDEVVTGFRLAIGGAQEKYGIIPDLCALGKIVGGGLPLAAVAGRADIIELTVPERPDDGRSVYVQGTLNGNPLAAAAGLATIEVMVEEDGPGKLETIGMTCARELVAEAARLSIPFQMIGPPCCCEPIFSDIDVYDLASYSAANRRAAKQFGHELMRRGVFCHPGSKLYFSLAHGKAELDYTCSMASQAMRSIRDSGYLQ
jgi:glutamate-1-semialdehyde 2,1-aminomutase